MNTALQILRDRFGYDQFRFQQQAIVDTLIDGADALVVMPTGGGKSLCYQIPALLREGVGVVVSPLIAETITPGSSSTTTQPRASAHQRPSAAASSASTTTCSHSSAMRRG